MKRLTEWKNETWLCNHCSMCADTICDDAGFYGTCPIYRQLGFECNTAKGHNIIALYLLQGSLKYSEDVADCVFKCTTCATCQEICAPAGNIAAQMAGTELKTFLPNAAKKLNVVLEGIREGIVVVGLSEETPRAHDCARVGGAPVPFREFQ